MPDPNSSVAIVPADYPLPFPWLNDEYHLTMVVRQDQDGDWYAHVVSKPRCIIGPAKSADAAFSAGAKFLEDRHA